METSRASGVQAFDKRALYGQFRAALPSNLQDDRYFKIFYSDVFRSGIAIVGLNPGGDPDSPADLQSASLFYEKGEHDYADCDYPIARKMRELFDRAGLATGTDAIRRYPKLNVVFHRSRSEKEAKDWNWPAAVEASRPGVAKILSHVTPELLVVEGFKTLEWMLGQQGWAISSIREVVPRHVRVADLSGPAWRSTVRAVVLAHPTGYRWSSEAWAEAARVLGAETRPAPPAKAAGPVVRKRSN